MKSFYLTIFMFIAGCSDSTVPGRGHVDNLVYSSPTPEQSSKAQVALENNNYTEAYNLLLPFAESGNPEIQFSMSLIPNPNYEGLPYDERCKLSLQDLQKWTNLAADGGVKNAITTVASNYRFGVGVPKDVMLAKCFEEAVGNKNRLIRCREIEGNQISKNPQLFSDALQKQCMQVYPR